MHMPPCRQGNLEDRRRNDYRCSPKLAPDEDGPVVADRVDLENTLRQIQSEGNNLPPAQAI
jgi:hypothetical protein